MNKIILLVFAFILTASLVFAATPRESPNLSLLKINLTERNSMMDARLGNLSERLQLRADRLDNVSTRVEKRVDMLRTRINATMNYGQCVSDMARARNDCYNSSKVILNGCRNATANNTIRRTCQDESRKDMDVCKGAFKSAKKNECGKIKASFMEKVRYAFA